MPVVVRCLLDLEIELSPLTQGTFHEFGTVIENPHPSLQPSCNKLRLPPNVMLANQGTALKHQDVTDMLDLYGSAPSGITSRAIMNMFVCAPRALQGWRGDGFQGTLLVELLERHPFTTQTFIPLGVSPGDYGEAYFLVIVAPSLPPRADDQSLPVPAPNHQGMPLPGRGLPDLRQLRAFVGRGNQAVTYRPGIFHAPMIVLGTRSIEFVVVQFANGVEIEDCQEVIVQHEVGAGIRILVPDIVTKQAHGSLKL